MAFAPCTACGQGFKGGAATMFPALVHGGERKSRRHKLCPADYARLREWADAHLSLVSVGDTFYEQEPIGACSNCNGVLVDAWAFFLNEYPRGAEDRQLFGKVCASCVSAVAEDWGIEP